MGYRDSTTSITTITSTKQYLDPKVISPDRRPAAKKPSQKSQKALWRGNFDAGLLVSQISSNGVYTPASQPVANWTRPVVSAPVPGDVVHAKSRKEYGPKPAPRSARSLFQLSKTTPVAFAASRPPTSGACPLLKLPWEIRNHIFSYLYDGAVVLDKGWELQDYKRTEGMNPRDLPVLYRLSKPAFAGQSTACVFPVSSHANTAMMFTCREMYNEFAERVYSKSAFAISLQQSAKKWLLGKYNGSAKHRNPHVLKLLDNQPERLLPGPSPTWINTIHLHMSAYGAPFYRSDITLQAQYYLGWRKTLTSLATECINLKEIHISIDVPHVVPLKVNLRQDWAWSLLPLSSCKSLTICTVELNMDWYSELIGALEEYLMIILKGGDRADGIAALKSAFEQDLMTEEGMSLIDEWEKFIMWNEYERELVEAAAEWQLMLPGRPKPRSV